MTPAQIDFLRDFAIDNLPRAKLVRANISRTGGNLYDQLAFSSVMALANPGTTAAEHAAASVLESVCLLRRQQSPLFPNQRADKLHHLTAAAHALCLHTGKTITWLGEAAPPEPAQEQPPAPAKPLPSIAGRWLSTKEAAGALGFAEQTLRSWASTETGPIRPTRAGRALRWSGDSILALLRGPVCVSQNPRRAPVAS